MMTPDQVRDVIGPSLSEIQATALADWYVALAEQIARFPESELKGLEPPLRSTPAPR
jgi:hypothetical protein